MDFIKRIWKFKQTKIVLVVLVIVGILAAAFFLAPGGEKNPVVGSEASSGNISQSSTTELENSQTPSETEITPDSSENTTSAEKTSTITSAPSEAQKPDDTTSSTPPKNETTSSKDQYQTDPVPEGKPKPQEPEDVTVDNSKKLTCTLSIRCDTILDNMAKLEEGKGAIVPKDGTILATTTVTFSEGESVFDILKRVTREKRIHMEFRDTPIYNSAYIEGIHNLYEFDCGDLSGWMFKVNDWFPNYGCSRYVVQDGDKIEWVYTCDLGADVGGGYVTGQE